MDRYLVYSDAEDLIALSPNFMVVQTLQTFVVLNIFWTEPLWNLLWVSSNCGYWIGSFGFLDLSNRKDELDLWVGIFIF
jgi:hypothetical protein